MGRRPKAETDKRTERLMIYLTPEEAAELAAVAEHQNTDKAKFAVASIQSAISSSTMAFSTRSLPPVHRP